LENLPHIAFLVSPEGEGLRYNKPFLAYHGVSSEGRRIDHVALMHHHDRAHVEAARAKVVTDESEYQVEARLLRHDGAYRWHRIHSKPLLDGSAMLGSLRTAVDIHEVRQANEILEQRVGERTAELERARNRLQEEIHQRQRTEAVLRESEHRFRTMYNRTPMALQSVDSRTRLLDVNDTWTELFGYARHEAVGRSPTDFMTPESAETYRRQAWPEMLASGGEVRTVDYQFVAKDGRVFDGRLSARGEFDANGAFVRSWSAIADVTAEKRADRVLRRVQRMEAVGQLTAGIAHDFNNLLTAILGNLEMLGRRPSGERERAERLIAGARAAAERGARLTAQLLAFSRQQRIAAEPDDANRVLREMLPLLRATIGGAISIELVPGADLWPAMLDPTQLELAVLNLGINARDAMPDGGTITIATANATRGEPSQPEEPAAGDYVAVSVSDSGTGIPEAVRERIFEPFFTTKDVGKGSGLGLPQVLGVVQQLGGGLSVRTAPGAGTTVTLFLPKAPGAADAATRPAGTEERILLVDDDDNVRMIAADMLRDAGYDVTEAESGPAALDILATESRPPAAMVVDVSMPAMTGVELAAIVEREYPAVPVVLMTGYAAAGLLPANSSYSILRKPFQSAELEAKVARALGRAPAGRG
jgi:PAS domain S-box-containing protein